MKREVGEKKLKAILKEVEEKLAVKFTPEKVPKLKTLKRKINTKLVKKASPSSKAATKRKVTPKKK
jgi:hypothetical protein